MAEGEAAPELDAVYRQFREKMSGLTFRVADEGAVGNSMVYIAATQYDFRSAIPGSPDRLPGEGSFSVPLPSSSASQDSARKYSHGMTAI